MESLLRFLCVALLFLAVDCKKRKQDADRFNLVPITATGPQLPTEKLYTNVYSSGCPFAAWFKSLPKGFGSWEDSLLKTYNKSWVGQGEPDGIKANDHNYNTKLGQGNTLAFLAGRLEINPATLTQTQRIGLFANSGTHKAIVRFSDFGADGANQLQRIAVKIPWASSWAKEINLLFTETIETFPLANFRDVSSFAGEKGIFDGIVGAYHQVVALGGSALGLIQNAGNGDALHKNYYSQLPYALGDKLAFRFKLTPADGQKPKSGLKANKAAIQQSIVDSLCSQEFRFNFEIQINSNPTSELVLKEVHKKWSEPWVSVGQLVLPKQRLTGCPQVAVTKFSADKALNVDLLSYLQKSLRVPDTNAEEVEGLHKSFLFHPVATIKDHKPLGETNTFRSDFYSHHATTRFQTISRLFKPRRVNFASISPTVFGVANSARTSGHSAR
eukprot:TRINITY_DN2882_c0_g1_i1.p1 TRINITY_DN2882_c0_g1~~TRINITY_DN2882_c0_g1_i1.p1  ORF type:complete len:443 (-),score=147.78 TRINITY_DN2882_c0_g1_i1:352-1680(-)